MATASARTTSTVLTVGVEKGSLINEGKKNKLLVVATICASVVNCFRTPYCLMRYSRAIFNYEFKTCHLRWFACQLRWSLSVTLVTCHCQLRWSCSCMLRPPP